MEVSATGSESIPLVRVLRSRAAVVSSRYPCYLLWRSDAREIQLAVCWSQRAGRSAAVIMSLIQSAKLNGHDPYRYLQDVLERLLTRPASRIEEILPHRWQPLSIP